MLKIGHPDPNQNKEPVGVRQPRTGEFLKAAAAGPLTRRRQARRRPAQQAGGLDHRPEERVLRRRDGQPRLEALPGRRPGRAGGRPARQQPADATPRCGRRSTRSSSSSKFDLKHLMRLILNSPDVPAFQRDAAGNETDTRFYSHYYARRLPAEVLLDAISQATGVPDSFPGYPVGLAGGPAARPGAEVVLPDAVRPVRPRDRLCLRAQRRGDDAAAAAPAERRDGRAEDSAPATAGWRSWLKDDDGRGQADRTSCSWRRCRGCRRPTERQTVQEVLADGRPEGRGVPRPVLGAAELEGVRVQSLRNSCGSPTRKRGSSGSLAHASGYQ